MPKRCNVRFVEKVLKENSISKSIWCGINVRNVKDHIKAVHTEDDKKPFQCQDCGKGFIKDDQLQRHRINIHLKTYPYHCRYGCDVRYNDASNRRQHEKKKHGKLFQNEKESFSWI